MKINYPAIESRLMDERENSEPETRPLNDRIIGRLQRDPMTSVGSRKNTREEIEINRIENHYLSQFDVVINRSSIIGSRLIEIPAVNLNCDPSFAEVLLMSSPRKRLSPDATLCAMKTRKIAIEFHFILDSAPHCLLQLRRDVEWKSNFYRLLMDRELRRTSISNGSRVCPIRRLNDCANLESLQRETPKKETTDFDSSRFRASHSICSQQ